MDTDLGLEEEEQESTAAREIFLTHYSSPYMNRLREEAAVLIEHRDPIVYEVAMRFSMFKMEQLEFMAFFRTEVADVLREMRKRQRAQDEAERLERARRCR